MGVAAALPLDWFRGPCLPRVIVNFPLKQSPHLTTPYVKFLPVPNLAYHIPMPGFTHRAEHLYFYGP
jgi:hypothetical protein